MATSVQNDSVGTEFWAQSEATVETETEKMLRELAVREANKPESPDNMMGDLRADLRFNE